MSGRDHYPEKQYTRPTYVKNAIRFVGENVLHAWKPSQQQVHVPRPDLIVKEHRTPHCAHRRVGFFAKAARDATKRGNLGDREIMQNDVSQLGRVLEEVPSGPRPPYRSPKALEFLLYHLVAGTQIERTTAAASCTSPYRLRRESGTRHDKARQARRQGECAEWRVAARQGTRRSSIWMWTALQESKGF